MAKGPATPQSFHYRFSANQVKNIRLMADIALKQLGTEAIDGIYEILVLLNNPLQDAAKADEKKPQADESAVVKALKSKKKKKNGSK